MRGQYSIIRRYRDGPTDRCFRGHTVSEEDYKVGMLIDS
jgi:hypothetical protein